MLLEEDIVNHLIANWDDYFPDLCFYRKEKQWKPNWRPDITAYRMIQLGEEYGYSDEPIDFKSPVFIEVKYCRTNKLGKYIKNDRDLIFEVQKALDAINRAKYPQEIIVISNDYSDPHILTFLLKHKIKLYKYKVIEDDFSDFEIEEYKFPILKKKES